MRIWQTACKGLPLNQYTVRQLAGALGYRKMYCVNCDYENCKPCEKGFIRIAEAIKKKVEGGEEK